MTRTEIVDTFNRMERREVDRRTASQMEAGRRLVQRRKAEAELTAAFDAALPLLPMPKPVPELHQTMEFGHWVGSFSDSWGEGR